MRNATFALFVSLGVLFVAGCSDYSAQSPPANEAPARQTSPAKSPESQTLAPPSTTAKSDAPSTPTTQAEADQKQQPQTSLNSSQPVMQSANQEAIQLSSGVALPQTGLNGTLMSFSVDYQFPQGEPTSSAYVWVIERAHGSAAKQAVKLSRQGTLPILINRWRPEEGPFQSHIEDASGKRVSASIEFH